MIKLPDFIMIPYPLLEDKEISLLDERLYGLIYWFTKLKNERCTASNKTLAELTKSTPMTISHSLTKLEERGYIRRLFKDEEKKNRMEIIPLVVFGGNVPKKEEKARYTPKAIDKDKGENRYTPEYIAIYPQDNRDIPTGIQKKNINNKNQERLSSTPSPDPKKNKNEPYSWPKALAVLEANPRVEMKILAYYFKAKGFEFRTKEQEHLEITKSIHVAKALAGYKPAEVKEAFLVCEEEGSRLDYNWNLNTVAKKIVHLFKGDT